MTPFSDLSGWPHCARCNKPVDQMFIDIDYCTRSLEVAVTCHGETEQISIPSDVLIEGGEFHLDGNAFVSREGLIA